MIIKILSMQGSEIAGFLNVDTEYQQDGLNALEFCMDHLERGRVLLAIDTYSEIENIVINLRRLPPIKLPVTYEEGNTQQKNRHVEERIFGHHEAHDGQQEAQDNQN